MARHRRSMERVWSSLVAAAAVVMVVAVVLGGAEGAAARRTVLQGGDQPADDDGQQETCKSFPEAAKGLETEDGRPLYLVRPPLLVVEEIDSGLYWATEAMFQNAFLVGNNGVILIDAPPTLLTATPSLIDAIKNITDLPVTHMFFSNNHKDHNEGAATIVEEWPDVEIIASADTKERIRERRQVDPEDDRPLPTITFNEIARISLDGELLLDDEATNAQDENEDDDFEGFLITIGNWDSNGDLIINSPSRKVMIFIDLVSPGWSPFQFLSNTPNVVSWINAHEKILDFDFDTFVGGHVSRLGTREDIEVQMEYAADLQKAVVDAVDRAGEFIEQEPENDPCADYDVMKGYVGFQTALTEACAAEMRSKDWGNRLGAFETFIDSNCLAMRRGVLS